MLPRAKSGIWRYGKVGECKGGPLNTACSGGHAHGLLPPLKRPKAYKATRFLPLWSPGIAFVARHEQFVATNFCRRCGAVSLYAEGGYIFPDVISRRGTNVQTDIGDSYSALL